MPLHPVGEARLDLLTDGLLLEIASDTYVVPLQAVSDLIQQRRRGAVVSRRYCGIGRRYLDVETGICLRRARSGRALVMIIDENIYSIPLWELQEVLHASGAREICCISRVITSARQLDDAHSVQASLGVWE